MCRAFTQTWPLGRSSPRMTALLPPCEKCGWTVCSNSPLIGGRTHCEIAPFPFILDEEKNWEVTHRAFPASENLPVISAGPPACHCLFEEHDAWRFDPGCWNRVPTITIKMRHFKIERSNDKFEEVTCDFPDRDVDRQSFERDRGLRKDRAKRARVLEKRHLREIKRSEASSLGRPPTLMQ